ncbi:MAG: sensor histidine kinase, partial [Limisphaerales bacterium]
RIPDPRILRPVPVLSPNELASLTRAFNQTVDELSRTTVSKAYLDNVIESILDTVIVTTPEGIIRTVNPAAAELLEIPRQDLVGRSIAAFLGPVWTRLEDPQPAWDRDTEITMRSGRTLHVSLSRSVMRGTEGAVLGFVFVAKDMSERKRSEDELRAALAEKEVLFKEINHRVKNNLQIVSSLLNLHARQVLEPTAGEILRDSRKRIQAMALVHEMLYRTGTPSQLDLAAYLHSLAGHLMASHGTVTHRIQVQTTLDRPLTSLDVAIPCGLIVNELVTNSLKHGFPEGSPGEIVIELANSTKGHYRITVRDNGIGWPQRPTPIPPSSLGLRLVRSLAEQLGGSLRQSNENGARVDLEFPRTLPPG